jgi:hypothetical protein
MAKSRTSGQGRPKGALNKATAELKELAQPYGPPSIARLALLAGLTDAPGSESEATQLGALRELLDRGYGKPAQAIVGGDADSAPVALTFRWAEAPPDEPDDTGDTEDAPATDP